MKMEKQKYRMNRVLLFAGTTEGRELAEYLSGKPFEVYVSTATEYGMELIEHIPRIHVISGRMREAEICRFIREHGIEIVVDATHPFARLATENMKKACDECGIRYIRCLREKINLQRKAEVDRDAAEQDENKEENNLNGIMYAKIGESGQAVLVSSVAEAVKYLQNTTGNIFITTGSKELHLYRELADWQNRCYARVLSSREAVEESVKLGFKGAHLIAMQGPFSAELNTALLRFTEAKYFVTKESGKAGGFEEKLEAAKKTKVTLVMIGRPEETGYSLKEVKAYFKEKESFSYKTDTR